VAGRLEVEGGGAVHYGLWVPNFGPYADLPLLADLAARSEAAGWEGWFLMDHVVHRGGYEPAVDPWMALALAARATDRIRLGPLVTPLPRRRPWNVARQAATLDRLSRGRVLLGLGIGSERTPEFHGLGEETALPRRASMLDEGLELLASMWSGEPVHHQGEHYRVDGLRFQPTPVQKPLPIWVGAVWPNRRPLHRATRWQGVFPLALPGPASVAEIRRVIGPSKDIAVEGELPADEWEKNGATWWLRRLPSEGTISAFESVIDAGPPV
jgi:alkanesulfonate monooxygenase SsuD/methylene tetrahydromethanopterin reductase-like flavin-dependent oxidoreductase (luciferase family)